MRHNIFQQSPVAATNPQGRKNLFSRAMSHFRNLNIQQKIGCGYALALSIAAIGTTSGIIYSQYYQDRAQKRVERSNQEELLLSKLQYHILESNGDQLQLIPGLEKKAIFEKEEEELENNLRRTQEIFAELKSATASHFNNSESDVSDLEDFIAKHGDAIDIYAQQVVSIIQQIKAEKLDRNRIKSLQATLIAFNQSDVALKFDNLSSDLDDLVDLARQEKVQTQAALKKAFRTGNLIIIISLVFSIAIAIFLAVYTSQAIARPLKAVTKVALQATEEANFYLQAPVVTEDEIGALAAAFNNLIQRVAKYTEELELARQTLENRVQERTEELYSKNEQLELAQQHLQQLNADLIAQAQDLNQAMQNLQQAQAQLIQSEKMSSLGQMVAGVAHEINNPVNFIYGNIEYASGYGQDLLDLIKLYQQYDTHNNPEIQAKIEAIDLDFLIEDMPKMLASIKSGTERIRQIVLSLRNFSRLDESEMKEVDIHEGIDSTLLILEQRLQPDIEVNKKYAKLPLIYCYPAQLNQVFMNIITNAIDALMECQEQGHKQIFISTETGETNQIKVRIGDNGIGISEEIKSKIFDPFFTTKPVGKGTGLGLSVCYQIIEKHGGKIELISELGKGAEFAIALPIKPN